MFPVQVKGYFQSTDEYGEPIFLITADITEQEDVLDSYLRGTLILSDLHIT